MHSPPSTGSRRPVVAIVGGGFTGAAIAFHLARAGVPAEILVFEPRARLGAGLAYGATDPVHRINVPATRMNLMPEEEGHFDRWLAADGALASDSDAIWSDGSAYPTRQTFGRYVSEFVQPYVKEGYIRHITASVTALARVGGRWQVTTSGGSVYPADFAVIATTHPKPSLPQALRGLQSEPRLIADGLQIGALDAIAADDRVLVVGSGLTAADVIASLAARGHRGAITMISRRGQRPRGHPREAFEPFGDFVSDPAPTAVVLLRRIRSAIRQAVDLGQTWHPVIDAVRGQGDQIWNTLRPDERRRLVRHLRPFWDTHRFRIAPQVDAVLDRKFADGSLTLMKASLRNVVAGETALRVHLFDRRRQVAVERDFDRIIVTTGPAHGDSLASQPYLKGLSDAGLIALDQTELGLKTSRGGRAIGTDGDEEPTLFIAGPLARATFGELMGLPQVSKYALFIADELERAIHAKAER